MQPNKQSEQGTDGRRSGRMFSVVVPLMLVLGAVAVGPVEAGGNALVAIGVSAGYDHTCALTATGIVDCFGDNGYGQAEDYVGEGATAVSAGWYHTCIFLATGNVHCYGDNRYGQSADYTGGDATAVSAGAYHTCVLLAAGNIHCYGDNTYGQSANYIGGDATAVAAGEALTCVLIATGNVDCYGISGSSSSYDYVGGDAVAVAAGGGSNRCFLTATGDARCHGPTIISTGGVTAVSVGWNHMCLLKTAGNVRCGWDNSHGQAEDYEGVPATAVAAGGYHTCVLKVTGNLHCYGSVSDGDDGVRYLLHVDELQTPSVGPVGQKVASTMVYDSDSDVCVDLVSAGGSSQNLGCVGRALLGPADPLVPRGETELLILGTGTGSVEVVEVTVGYHYDNARLYKAASLLGGSVEAWGAFAPGDQSWFLNNGDDVDLFIMVTVYQDGDVMESRTVSVPYIGQALAAAEKTAGTL